MAKTKTTLLTFLIILFLGTASTFGGLLGVGGALSLLGRKRVV